MRSAPALLILLAACGATTADPVPDAATALPPLQVGVMVHVETQQAWMDDAFLQVYLNKIRNDFLPALTAHGARLTWEFRGEITRRIAEIGDPIFDELLAAGQGVGVHADKGYPASTQEIFTAELVALKAGLDPLVPEARHVSGICSELDWVTAAADAGYRFGTGSVAFCVMGMPLEERPAEYADCAAPNVCHDVYPVEIEARIHPRRVVDSPSWLTDDRSGRLVILPSSGGLVCAAEEAAGAAAGNCRHTADDVPLFFADLDAAVAAREPATINVYYRGWSYGATLDPEVTEDWLTQLDTYVADGRVEWATLGQMYDQFVEWEP